MESNSSKNKKGTKEKDQIKVIKEENRKTKSKKLTEKQQEIIITIVAILISIAVGIFLGKVLYEAVN